MGSRFKHPDHRDDEEEQGRRAHAPTGISRFVEQLKGLLGAMFGAIIGLFFVVAVIASWATNIAGCFVKPARSVGDRLKPRAPQLGDPVEYRLVQKLAQGWTAGGRSLDGLNVWVVDDPSINAASMGDGIFILWRGLNGLEDDELDAVYAHELAHDQLKHSRRTRDLADVTNVIGEALGAVTGSGDSGTRTLKKWSAQLVLPSYNRQQELEADQNAVTLLRNLSYGEPAVTLCGAFVKLREASGDAGGGFFASHPALTDRLAAIRGASPSEAAARACR